MSEMLLSKDVLKKILKMQRDEVKGYYVYSNIAKRTKDEENKKILTEIAKEEKAHADIWEQITGKKVSVSPVVIWFYSFISVVFGFTFTIKFMERGESLGANNYKDIATEVPQALKIAADEEKHEAKLLDMLDEERLRYVGSMVLGLSDALVELTGTLAGLTFALGNNRLVALSGLITGISATLSMASSEYLSSKSEGSSNALKSATYTGIAYLFTVALLILPYLILPAGSALPALLIMLVIVLLIIFGFNFYISVAQELDFKSRFGEMAIISLGVAAISFVIGLVVKHFLGIEI